MPTSCGWSCSDPMVIEATFLERDAAMALDYGHLTAAKAAELAATAGVKRLVLTHIPGRYPDEEILAEAVKIFPNSRVAANLDRLAVCQEAKDLRNFTGILRPGDRRSVHESGSGSMGCRQQPLPPRRGE